MQTFYLILKTLHILAFIVGIGVTFANIIAYNQFWKIYEQDRSKGIAAFAIIRGFFAAGSVSMIVLLLAGIGMLAMADWSFVQVLWFQLKLALIVLIFVNGLTLGRTSAMKVQALVEGNAAAVDIDVSSVRSRTRLFFTLQLLIFSTIVILSVFRFG